MKKAKQTTLFIVFLWRELTDILVKSADSFYRFRCCLLGKSVHKKRVEECCQSLSTYRDKPAVQHDDKTPVSSHTDTKVVR